MSWWQNIWRPIKHPFGQPQEVMGINERNLSMVYPNNPRKYFPYADDKVLTKEVLHEADIPCAKTYAVIRSMGELEEKVDELLHLEKMAIKPSKGSGGGGIWILFKAGEKKWTTPSGREVSYEMLKMHLANIIFGVYSLNGTDKAIVEYCLEPHEFFNQIYPNGVPDFRIIVYKDQLLLGMVRIPTDKSGGKANLHQGAIGVGIDMEKGEMTNVFDGEKYFDCHPDTQKRITGLPIPRWDEAMDIALKTSKAFPLDYLGVDIVFDNELGPLVMEINVRPGLGIQLANKKGLKPIIQEIDAKIK